MPVSVSDAIIGY